MVLSLVRHGALSRESLMDALTFTRDYNGLHGRISFSSKRVNSWLWVLTFDGERVNKIDGFTVE
jgi:hypothetical protein